MCYKVLIACFLIISVSNAKTTTNRDAIGFPESEENPKLNNKENRKPVFLPAMCPVNELYYPGDQKDDWICDCRPAYIYHPGTDECWPAFQRGPCPDGQYLKLPQNSVIPVCENNPCVVDSYVAWNGKCEKLGATAPCDDLFPATSALGVNATNIVVGCVKLNLDNRFGEDTPVIPVAVPCPPGCKRSINGKCVKTN